MIRIHIIEKRPMPIIFKDEVFLSLNSTKINNFSGKDKNNIKMFLGFWTLSIFWCLKEQDVSETGSVSFLR
jgi:hypothetical protein